MGEEVAEEMVSNEIGGVMPKYQCDIFWFEDSWSMPDPLSENLEKALWTARYDFENLTKTQMHRILRAAESYCHFAGHPAPTYMMIKQLRQIRKAVREHKDEK